MFFVLKEFRFGHRVPVIVVEHRVKWVLKVGVYYVFCLERGVAPLTASQQFRLGHRVSDCIVEHRV